MVRGCGLPNFPVRLQHWRRSIVAWVIGLGRIRIIKSEKFFKFIVLPHIGSKSGLHVLGHPAAEDAVQSFLLED
jgi:hypothetical protein